MVSTRGHRKRTKPIEGTKRPTRKVCRQAFNEMVDAAIEELQNARALGLSADDDHREECVEEAEWYLLDAIDNLHGQEAHSYLDSLKPAAEGEE